MRKAHLLLVASVMLLALPIAAGASSNRWTASFNGITDSAVTANGGIVVASGDDVSSLKDGSVLWSWEADEEVRKVAAAGDGAVLAAYGSTLVKLDSEGKLMWKADTFDLAYSLNILDNGMILVGYEYGMLAFGPEGGKYLWEHYAHEECDT